MRWFLAPRSLALSLVCAACLGAVVRPAAPVSYIFTRTARYEPRAWVAGAERFPEGATLMVVAGGTRRPVSPGFFASADASISFDGKRILFSGKHGRADHWQVWEVLLNGGEPKRLTTVDADCLRPLYLPDGRIVYTRSSPGEAFLETSSPGGRLTFGPARVLTDDVLRDGRILFEMSAGATAARELFTVYPDGTGVEAMRCDHGIDRGEARQVPSGDVVFSADGDLARFAAALAKQTPAVSKAMGPVAAISDDVWIVTMRGPTGRYGLYLWSVSGSAKPLDVDAVQPVIVASRVAPLRFPSALVPTRTSGNLLCLDARVGQPEATPAIRQVRYFTRTAGGATVPLGEAAVESDGSFYVQVPADQPLRLELLDSDGKTVRGEHGWFWMKPSEQRVCVGCHAGPERTSENKTPAVLLRSITPARLLGQGK